MTSVSEYSRPFLENYVYHLTYCEATMILGAIVIAYIPIKQRI